MDMYIVIPISVFGGGGIAGAFWWALNDMRKSLRAQNGNLKNTAKTNETLVDLNKSLVDLVRTGQGLTENYQSLVGVACADHATQKEKLEHVEKSLDAIHRRFDTAVKK